MPLPANGAAVGIELLVCFRLLAVRRGTHQRDGLGLVRLFLGAYPLVDSGAGSELGDADHVNDRPAHVA